MLPVVTLLREYKKDCTLGAIALPSGKLLKSLELPWRNNQPNISCFPEGVYIAKWLERSASGKYKRIWHIQNVPGRAGILWHTGNLVRHTKGCTLIGVRHGALRGLPAVLSSLVGINRMRRELEGQDFILVVAGIPR